MADELSASFRQYNPDDPLFGRDYMKSLWRPGLGEYIGASVAHGFDLTSGVRFAENVRVAMAEGRSVFEPWSALYAELKGDMRFTPELMTEGELASLEAMAKDAAARLNFADNVLGGVIEDADRAQNRRDARAEMVRPYTEMLAQAGYSRKQADAYGMILAASAERFAAEQNMTPAAWLEKTFAGFWGTTHEAFRDPAGAARDDFLEQAYGITRRMSNAQKRRKVLPIADAVYGKLDRQSFERNYGKERARELVALYGGQVFAKKGTGVGFDVLSANYGTAQSALEASNSEDAFETLMMPNDQFERMLERMAPGDEFQQSAGRVLYQDIPDAIGAIDLQTAEKIGLRPGALRLTEGDLNAIEGKHGAQFRQAGFADGREFVNYVLTNVDAVYKGRGDTYSFVTRGEFRDGRVFAEFEVIEENGNYRITTAQPIRKSFFNNKEKPLWERAQSNHSLEGIPSAISGQSDLGLDLTAPLKNVNILESSGPRGPRGAMTQLADGRYIVGLFKSKNLSTVLHETSHFWLEQLREAARNPNASEWVKTSWANLQQVYGFSGFMDTDAEWDGWRDIQERFAREFEAYAREGKAPSWELQSAFNAFRNWLTNIYTYIRQLLGDNELNPKVREVFDNILATEEEIAESQRAGPNSRIMEEMGEAGEVTSELAGRYAKAAQAAHDKAAALIAARRLVERRRVENHFRYNAMKRVDADPFHQLVTALRSEGGINFEAFKEAISEEAAYKLREKWNKGRSKNLFSKKGSANLLEIAERFDQDSPRDLAGMLFDQMTRDEAIESQVQQALNSWEKEFDGAIEYSSAMDEALALELEALTGKQQASPTALRREFDRRVGVSKGAKADAEYKALKASLRKQEPITRAAFKAWRKAADAERDYNARWRHAEGERDGATRQAEKDLEKLLKAKEAAKAKLAEVREQERLKRAALGAAYRARVERGRLMEQIGKAASSKSVDDAYRQQILRLVAHWKGLGTPGMMPRDAASMPTLMEFMQNNVGLFEEEKGLIPDWIYAESSGKGYSRVGDLSLEELRDVHRTVKLLEHKGRQYGKLLSQGKQTEARLAVADMAEAAGKLIGAHNMNERQRQSFVGQVRGFFKGLTANLAAMDMLCRALNGYFKTGPFTDYIITPLRRAMSDELRLKREFEKKLDAALAPLRSGEWGKAFAIDGVVLPEDVQREWGGLWDREKVLSVALNLGNEGNLKALMRGYGWDDAQLARITSGLTVVEWKAVQGIWDMIEELYPGLSAVHEKIHGVPMAKVQTKAFTVQAADGAVTLRGGYYPLIFDQRFSQKAEDNVLRDEIQNAMEAVTRSANPQSGMTKERKGGTLPPKLSMSVIGRHLMDTIHYTTHAEALRDVAFISRRDDFRRMFERAAGTENYALLLPWLQHIARPGAERIGQFDKMAEWLARRGTLVALALNMKTAFMQLASFGNSMVEVGAGNFAQGAYQLLSNKGARSEVRAKSAYMESRTRNFDSSIAEHFERMTPAGAKGLVFAGQRFTLQQVQDAQLALIRALDAAVAYPTWLGAYNAAIRDGMAEADAVVHADDAVIAAQSSGGAMDTPALLRKRGFIKLFTTFMSFANRDFNRKKYYLSGLRETMRGGRGVGYGEFSRHFALEWVMPSVMGVLIVSMGKDGELPDGEDFIWELLGNLTMGIPVLRDVVRGMQAKSKGKGFGGGRMGGSVGFMGFESAMNVTENLLFKDEINEEKLAKELARMIGFMTGLGTPQLLRTWEGSNAYFVDDAGGPLAPLLGKPEAQ